MAEVDVAVGGRRYKLACRDGEEDQLRTLASMVDRKAGDITRAIGDMTEARVLLMSAILLADELNDAKSKDATPPSQPDLDPSYAQAIERIAERIERLADRLNSDA
ncbi:cell division protein ZapA [Sphingomonas montanisoli]|uniref:Cell division protein ZapA n=1 Tax=Sphingomonas montanisoli TaxID=2606412 RepID=A0A5D9C3S1_9SPHN|nr:cell division protein ZapA [Sphingomonas montanisoli]TZG26394.1 cell division protein ZapA [Sphingomonas montanisoli]